MKSAITKNTYIFSFILLIIFSALARSENHYGLLEGGDYYAFWMASKAFAAQINPYNFELVRNYFLISEKLLVVYFENVFALPLVFTLIYPFSFFSFEIYLKYIFISHVLLYTFGTLLLLKRMYPEFAVNQKQTFPFVNMLGLMLITFLPATFFIALEVGPIITFSYFGLCCYFYNVDKSLSSNFWGGVGLSITLLKPHLLFLVVLFFFFSCLKEKKYNGIFGFMFGLLLLLLPVLFLYPEVLSHYLNLVLYPPSGNNPISYYTPTLVSIMSRYYGFEYKYIFIFSIILFFLLSFRVFIEREREVLIKVACFTLFSILATPYCWTYDFIVLQPIFIYFYTHSIKKDNVFDAFLALLTYLLVNFYILDYIGSYQNDIIYPLSTLVLTCYFLTKKRILLSLYNLR